MFLGVRWVMLADLDRDVTKNRNYGIPKAVS